MYETLKILHIISFVSWFAGLFYLPRLFVYHIENNTNKEMNEVFQKMSGKKFNVNEVIKGISKAKSEGFKNIKINTVIRKGVNEKSIMGLVDYCRSEGHILRFIEYMDVGTLNSWDIKNVVNSEYILKIISNNYKLSKIRKKLSI